MPKVYTKSEILDKLEEALKKNDAMDILYTEKFINYRGYTSDSKESYSEIIAEALLTQLEKFENIRSIDRKYGYKTSSHNGKTANAESNRKEERFALELFNTKKDYDHIGTILDYQIPIKNIRGDKAGKIDLLADNNNELILLELKVDGNKDTLLRCVLEIVTYWHQINHDKLYEKFVNPKHSYNKKPKKAILVPLMSSQHEEYKNKNTNMRNLMLKLDVEFFLFECKNGAINILCHHEK